MEAIQFRHGKGVAAVAVALVLCGPAMAGGVELRDEPVVWQADDRRNIEKPAERDPSLAWTVTQENLFRPIGRLFHPGRLMRKVGTAFGGDHVPMAANVNRLGEVPNSSWFTNRIGLFPLTPEAVGLGPGSDTPSGNQWTVIRAKTEGVTPGFTIKDTGGGTYLIKFDPPDFPGTSAAAVIAGKILHAAGYNVPVDAVVELERDRLVLADGVQMTLTDGSKRLMTPDDLHALLDSVSMGGETIRAISSKYLSGEPVGPFDWLHRRKDDPNDHVDHEERRELRGLRVIAGWINHFDLKQLNTLDMYVEEDGRRFVRHHLIDFASTLGASASGVHPNFGHEYAVDMWGIMTRTAALGFHEDPWRQLERPEGLDEVGYLESATYRPRKFKTQYPNSAFANLTDRDGYWAAKIISAFTDEHLRAAVAAGRYQNPDAAAYVARTLAERRDKEVRYWFDRVTPLDFFSYDGARIRFHDLGEERGVYPGGSSRYRVRMAATDAGGHQVAWSEWYETGETNPEVPASVAAISNEAYPFLAAQLMVDRGTGWSAAVTVYLARTSHRVVGVER